MYSIMYAHNAVVSAVNSNAEVTVHPVPPRGVFVCNLHENPETACAKMSVLCSFCVHHVAVNGEAVNSNTRTKPYGKIRYAIIDHFRNLCYNLDIL